MTEHRWSKFWWQDYEADDALRLCSLAAQGLWMRMLCAMHRGAPYGHLAINGTTPSNRQMSIMLSATEKEVAKLVPELGAAGVLSRNDDGLIYSRRMVRDKAITDEAVANGKRGGNPTLKGNGKPGGLTPPDNPGGVDDASDAPAPECEKPSKNEESISLGTSGASGKVNAARALDGKTAAQGVDLTKDSTRRPLTPPDNPEPPGTLKLEAEADTEAESKTSKSSLIPRDADAVPVASKAPWPPDPHPSAVTARVGQVVARLEGRARGQPFMTPRGPVRSVAEQAAAVTPTRTAKVLAPEHLATARAQLRQGRG